MKNWAILGDFEFDIITSPQTYSDRTGTVWSEHALIKGKPQLEYSGDELDEIQLVIKLHANLTDTYKQIEALKRIQKQHKPLPFVLGDGIHKGYFVIVSIDNNHEKTLPGGKSRVATLSITLKEYPGTPQTESPNSALLGDVATYIDAQTRSELKNTLQSVTSQAKLALNLLKTGVDAYQTAKADPFLALQSLGNLLSFTEQVAIPLTDISLSDIQEASSLVLAAKLAVTNAQDAVSYLKDDSLAVLSRIDAACSLMQSASATMEKEQDSLINLAVNVITRKG